MSVSKLTQDAVLRIGEVSGVDGRRIYVLVDKNKNVTDMFLDGDILKNISVNSYIEIRKGFLSIIGRVEGEKIQEEYGLDTAREETASKRLLTVALTGYIDERGIFTGGTRELPLLGNEAYILTKKKIHLVHNLVRDNSPSISIASIDGDDVPIEFPIDGLFNSHIAIFGNTGSGKTNTLAALYQELIRTLRERNESAFFQHVRLLFFDFNGEYTAQGCLTTHKTVYSLSTRDDTGDKLPMDEDGLLDIEVLSILADATEKTQKPFLRRTLRLYRQAQSAANPEAYIKTMLRGKVASLLQMSDKIRAFLLLDYFRELLPAEDGQGEPIDIASDLDWHNTSQEFRKNKNVYLAQSPDRIPETVIYGHVDNFVLEQNLLFRLIAFLYVQLITDVLANRAHNDHIIPVINRLKSKKPDIEKLFSLEAEPTFWSSNVVVVNLNNVNLDMKKTLPLLLAKKLYAEHKTAAASESLTLIIDEAHNILSTESFREAESWKDYRLETFEEIIKEGRKFGVFVTIASQRPNDISPTITSQAHNYFIHRLINERDLNTIASAVSYIDRVTEESIPTLPTGTAASRAKCHLSSACGLWQRMHNRVVRRGHSRTWCHHPRLSGAIKRK
jgi:uncharacterized protein